MLYKELIELFDMLDSASASGSEVVEYLDPSIPCVKWKRIRLKDQKVIQIW